MLKVLKITLRAVQMAVMAVLAVLIIFNLYIIASKKITGSISADFLGFSVAVVSSGSMEPEISVDDMIIIKKQKDYQKGDIITFERDGSLITHRIIEKAENSYMTKGDANNAPDTKEVDFDDVVGKTVFVIPEAGRVIYYLRTPLGMAFIVFVGLLLLELPVLFNKKKEGMENGK